MSYYDEKKKAISLISALAAENRYIPADIAFMVLRETGYSKRFTLSYIKENTDRDIWKLVGGVVNVPGKTKDDKDVR